MVVVIMTVERPCQAGEISSYGDLIKIWNHLEGADKDGGVQLPSLTSRSHGLYIKSTVDVPRTQSCASSPSCLCSVMSNVAPIFHKHHNAADEVAVRRKSGGS
jgi:hypothetical protein